MVVGEAERATKGVARDRNRQGGLQRWPLNVLPFQRLPSQTLLRLQERRVALEKIVMGYGEAPAGIKEIFELCRGFERAYMHFINVSIEQAGLLTRIVITAVQTMTACSGQLHTKREPPAAGVAAVVIVGQGRSALPTQRLLPGVGSAAPAPLQGDSLLLSGRHVPVHMQLSNARWQQARACRNIAGLQLPSPQRWCPWVCVDAGLPAPLAPAHPLQESPVAMKIKDSFSGDKGLAGKVKKLPFDKVFKLENVKAVSSCKAGHTGAGYSQAWPPGPRLHPCVRDDQLRAACMSARAWARLPRR